MSEEVKVISMRLRARHVPVVIVLIALLLTGCATAKQPLTESQPAVQPAAEPQAEPVQLEAGMAPEAKRYLDELLEFMERNSIHRYTINWDEFRAKVFDKASGAKSIEETRFAITEALRLLDDRHSHYIPKNGRTISAAVCATAPVSTAPASVPLLPSTVGYIKVSGFAGTSGQAAAFARSIQETINWFDSQGVTGWLVDLRGNTGGNMWPMITGLGPLLGEGTLGYFIDPKEAKSAWELRDGVAYLGDRAVDSNRAAFHMQTEAPRVAVLTDGFTASSGEAIAIAFRGRADSRSFGTPTCGLSTSNRSFTLSDGAVLALTTAVMADRTGKAYGGPVVPDEVIDDPANVAERALQWLETGN
jgi:carboxyl-terminal processing protease